MLAQYGLLAGRRATCYPGFESKCTGAHMVDADVVTDGPITTGRALGAAIPFALELVRLLTDEQARPRARPRRSPGDMTVDNARARA